MDRFERDLAGNGAGLCLWKIQEECLQFQAVRPCRPESQHAQSIEGAINIWRTEKQQSQPQLQMQSKRVALSCASRRKRLLISCQKSKDRLSFTRRAAYSRPITSI